MKPEKAFILAAGLGTRLRPLTDAVPKPMVRVHGETMLEQTIIALQSAGVHDFVVNTHYKADVIHGAYAGRADIVLSHEEELLDTGGGIKKTLAHFGGQDFYVLSGDGLWQDGPSGRALDRLASAWDPAKMDILMLLQPVSTMRVTPGVGDYHLDAQGRATRALDKSGAYMFTSIRINAPRIFENTPEGKFSYLALMDRAQKQGRLYGLVHDGEWFHISAPEDVVAVEAYYGERE